MSQQQQLDIFNIANACTDSDLLSWANQNGISAQVITLKTLNNSIQPSSSNKNLQKNFSRTAFIFTGSKDDEYNKNNDHHWLAQDGNLLFDSYGAYSDYKLPQQYEFFKTNPQRLQEFNSVVCGAYCCAFLAFMQKNQNEIDLDYLSELFKEEYELGNNRTQNDQKILNWYKATGGKFSSPDQPIPTDNGGSTIESMSPSNSPTSNGGMLTDYDYTS